MFLGGACGGGVVTANIVGVTKFGAAAFSSVFVAAQLAAACAFDLAWPFGLFAPVAPSPQRLVGLFLAVVAAVVFQLAPVA
jgi:uncharacterized membrane protein YdcZ (DUF606 family)